MLKHALHGGPLPESWQTCPENFLAAAEFKQGSFASSSEIRQAVTAFRTLTVDGTVNTNKRGLTLVTWTTLNSNGSIAPAMSELCQAESDVDLAFSTESALPMFYGRMLAWLALLVSDGAGVLQRALVRFALVHCSGGPHKTHVGLCWWHAVLKVFIVDYSSKCGADDELGRVAKAWLSKIVWESVSVTEAEVTYTELMAYVDGHTDGNRDLMATFLEEVWRGRARLLACLRAGSPVGSLKGTYNEVFNYMVKNQIGSRGAGRLVVLADALVAVSKSSVRRRVPSSSLPITRPHATTLSTTVLFSSAFNFGLRCGNGPLRQRSASTTIRCRNDSLPQRCRHRRPFSGFPPSLNN